MKRLLIDTSYLLGHFHSGDAHHAAALGIQDAAMNSKWDELVLLDAVFIETITLLARRTNYGQPAVSDARCARQRRSSSRTLAR